MTDHYCHYCGIVKIPEPEYCCAGNTPGMDHFCGCMGLPIDPPYCEECWDKIKKGEDE